MTFESVFNTRAFGEHNPPPL